MLKQAAQSNKKKHTRGIAFLWALSLCLLIAAIAASIIYANSPSFAQVLDLEDYTFVGRDSDGIPRGVLDVEAILTQLRLPSPNNPRVNVLDYPDVNALCSMSMRLSFTSDPSLMQIDIDCDTATLKKHGIVIEKLSWQQQIKGSIIDNSIQIINQPTQPLDYIAPQQPQVPAREGRLSALVDENGNGFNLTSVCQEVHSRRDSFCKDKFGYNYSTSKTHIYFIVDSIAEEFYNLYRAVYTVKENEPQADVQRERYFAIDIYNLYWDENGKVAFESALIWEFGSAADASSLAKFDLARYTVTSLYQGGVIVENKALFDQNGFIRFVNLPTSYRMANGIMWSPTYDELSEDDIWSLTATQGHSLANLLRYARKEIYARYYVAFDRTTEAEFYNHYNRYLWYDQKSPDWSDRMTQAEKNNILLLSQIQNLLEK